MREPAAVRPPRSCDASCERSSVARRGSAAVLAGVFALLMLSIADEVGAGQPAAFDGYSGTWVVSFDFGATDFCCLSVTPTPSLGPLPDWADQLISNDVCAGTAFYTATYSYGGGGQVFGCIDKKGSFSGRFKDNQGSNEGDLSFRRLVEPSFRGTFSRDSDPFREPWQGRCTGGACLPSAEAFACADHVVTPGLRQFEDPLGLVTNIIGTPFDDVIVGTNGNDLILSTGGSDIVCGRSGADVINGGSGRDILNGEGGEDLLQGSLGADFLDGGTGDDHIRGGRGHDFIFTGADNDVNIGGPGVDWLAAEKATQGIKVNLTTELVRSDGFGFFDRVVGIENVKGTRFEDLIIGDDKDNILIGRGGADIIVGRGGTDRLIGNGENDKLDGGPGDDTLDGGSETDTCRGETELSCELDP